MQAKGHSCGTIQEKGELEQELSRMKTEVAERAELQRSEEAGPLFALQTAQANLKERYTKMKHQNEDLKKQLQDLVQKQVGSGGHVRGQKAK